MPAADWPKLPYRGLDFYHEADACLFRERDEDVRRCAGLLLGYGVKILLLQGSSGSGKSSFLRAGLIPYLKHDGRHRLFLLNSRDSVVRCTADPLPEIAGALLNSLKSKEVFVDSGCQNYRCGEVEPLEEAVRSTVSHDLEAAIGGSREQLGTSVVKALLKICAELPGKLLLVLDQAEEVLTRTTGGLTADEAPAAFFRFLEDVYLHNIDVRILVSLRTEYYGLFRDRLRISDDRISDRPKSGGLEPYLLRPLREKAELIRVVEFPTKVRRDDGTLVYNFVFEDGLVARLVDDLLTKLPTSVTPALQVVCASLYALLTDSKRTIRHQHYNSQKELAGIISSYIQRGLGIIGVKKEDEIDKWHSLLYKLVSRQGGGTVVSLSETSANLVHLARDLGVKGNVESALAKLAGSHTPLLRGEPPENPQEFSLKHDVLAVALSEWHERHEGKAEATIKQQRINRAIVAGFFIFFAMASAVVLTRDEALFGEKKKRIELTNNTAQRSATGDYRESLLLLAATCDVTARPNLYERLNKSLASLHTDSVKALRKVFVRAPRFLYDVDAASYDSDGRHLALLRKDVLEVLTLPLGDDLHDTLEVKKYPLAAKSGERDLKLSPAVGFVEGLGPAAFLNGRIYFWNEQGEQLDRNIWEGVLASVGSANWFRMEFISGVLQVTSTESRPRDNVSIIKVLRLDGPKLKADSQDFPPASEIASMGIRTPSPVFSDNPDTPELFAYLDERSPSNTGKTSQVLELGMVDRNGSLNHDQVPRPDAAAPVRRPTLAFLAHKDAALVKQDDWEFDIYHNLATAVDMRRQHVAVEHRSTEKALPPGVPWLYPPLAGTQLSKHVRVAWLDADGVSVVESTDEDPGHATRFMGDNKLLSSGPGGTKLQFTPNGDFLMLLQQPLPTDPVSVRIWDLRQAWQTRVDKADDEELYRAACRLVRTEGAEGGLSQSQMELLNLFQFDKANRGFCIESKEQK